MPDMDENIKMKYVYRVRYSRLEGVKFVSHLDMLKLFERACRRADLPVSYSSGFNPHPEFVFGMPLPVGLTSDAEYVDIKTDVKIPVSEVETKINGKMPDALRVREVVLLPQKAANIMKSVIASKYEMKVLFSDVPYEKAAFSLYSELAKNEPLIVDKKTKSGTKQTDIRPMIRNLEIIEPEENSRVCRLLITTDAGNIKNLRPELALNSLCDVCSIKCEIEAIHRMELIFEK